MRSRVVGTIIQTTVGAADNIVGTDFQDMSSAAINNNVSSWVAFGQGVGMAGSISQIAIDYTSGEPIAFRVAASAGAAATAPNKFILNQGTGMILNIKLNSGDLLWVRSLSANAVTTGYIAANYIGS